MPKTCTIWRKCQILLAIIRDAKNGLKMPEKGQKTAKNGQKVPKKFENSQISIKLATQGSAR